jgi:hypothetical protein
VSSLLELLELLVKASAPLPPPKKPDSPLAQSLMSLGEVSPHTLNNKSAERLWTPQEQKLFLPPQDIGGSLAKQLTPFEQVALLGKAVQGIPETISDLADAIQGVPKAVAELGAGLRTLGITIGRGLNWLDRHLPRGPLDPYGHPVPLWNVQLYLLAQRAYQGDYRARAVFLNEIEADSSPDNILLVGPLLEPTFNPIRKDLRTCWEQEPPEQARRKLRDLLAGFGKRDGAEERSLKKGEYAYEHSRRILTPSEFADIEQYEDERILYEWLSAVLPEQQFMFCWYRSQGMKYKEIAAEMGIGLNTVKTYARLAKNNPNLRVVLGQ